MQDANRQQGRGAIYGVAAAAALLLFIVNTDTELSVWVTLLLRPLMHGVSQFKTNFLLVFVLTVAAVELLRSTTPGPKTINRLIIVVVTSASTAGLIGMATFLELSLRLHLPMDKYAYFFNDGYVSINQFAHLHVTKTGLYYLVSTIGLGDIANHADTGLPFAGLVYPPAVIAVLILAAVTMIALIAAAPAVIRSFTGRQRSIALILYSLAGSHTVKCLVDGGPLSYDFLPSIVITVLALMHARGEPLAQTARKYWSRILVTTVVSLGLIGLFSLDVALVVQPQQYLFFYGIYFLLLLPLLRVRFTGFVPRLMIALTVVWCLLYYHRQTTADIAALHQRLAPSASVSMIDDVEESGAAWPEITDISTASSGKRLLDVYRDNGQRALRNRSLLIRNRNESGYGGFLFALRALRADSVLRFPPGPHLTFRGISVAGAASDSLYVFRVEFDQRHFPSLWSDDASILDENNKFAALFYLDRYFRQHGLREYVLIPLYYEETA